MEELVKKIYDLLCKALLKRQPYSYSFQRYDGTEKNKQITIQNSVEYEFINTGSTVVIINDNLRLYPFFTGRGNNKVKFRQNKNEKDMTIYEYRFEIIPLNGDTMQLEPTALGFQISKVYNAGGTASTINELQVVVKQLSSEKG